MDPARKRHFLQRWDRRQLFVRDRIREHLHDVAVDARIDWLHHRDLNNRSTLDGTLSPRRVPINTSNNPIDYLSPRKKNNGGISAGQQYRYEQPSRVAVTKLMSPFPKSAADVIEDYLKGSLNAVNRTNPDMDYRVMADDRTSRWEENIIMPDTFKTGSVDPTKNNTSIVSNKNDLSIDQSLEKIRDSFSERTVREIDRTRKRMHDMSDKNRSRYLNLTKQYLGLENEEDFIESDDDEEEEGEDILNDISNNNNNNNNNRSSSMRLYGETVDDDGLATLYRIEKEEGKESNNNNNNNDNNKINDGMSIGTSYASPKQRKILRKRKKVNFGYSKSGGGGIGDDVPIYISPDEERRVFSLLNPRLGTKGKVWTVSTPMVWTPETTITMKGDVLNPTINNVNNTTGNIDNKQIGRPAPQPSERSRFRGRGLSATNSVTVSRSPMISRTISKYDPPGKHRFRHAFPNNKEVENTIEEWHSFRPNPNDTLGATELDISNVLPSKWETDRKAKAIIYHKRKLYGKKVEEDAEKRFGMFKGRWGSQYYHGHQNNNNDNTLSSDNNNKRNENGNNKKNNSSMTGTIKVPTGKRDKSIPLQFSYNR